MLFLTSFSTFSSCWSTGFWFCLCFKNLSYFKNVLLNDGQNLPVSGYIGWCELMFVFFLNILVCNLLFLIYISVFKNKIFPFNISYSNVTDGAFVFNWFSNFTRFFLVPLYIKNILFLNLRYIRWYMNFLSKWSIKMSVYEGAQAVPMARPNIYK